MDWIRSVLVHTFLSLISSLAFGIPEETPHHQLSGNVKGKLIFHQMEGNSTLLRKTGNLASYTKTVVSFELYDPRHILRSVSFTYTWDLGNGEVHKGPEPFVKFYYALPGNYTLKLSIETDAPQHSRMTGLYSVDLTVLDAIRYVDLIGPVIYNVDQNSRLSFEVGGSPPVWLCWRVLPDCHTPNPASCSLVQIYENTFCLDYTFTSVGTHCLDLSVKNNISSLQTFYSVYVQSGHVSLFFLLPCAAVIVATLIFISVTVCRPRQRSLMCKGDYVPFTDIELRAKDATVPLQSNSSASKTNETQLLLYQQGPSYNPESC
ncbi:transmembrane protein 130 precursor [Danio rerio]|uniref:Transmembrane protein 130 precursor n=1 Tax=Danio rerio TaxID=7955 RepID=A8KC42_DANRE|nr:transmembrane protein 130 precursor [Danio rerio]AAI54351.1 Zgc:174622 protein [Danio rerio]|eukprot:NP_001103504.1 transmembrane protein 130 precursor [Danio rerio]